MNEEKLLDVIELKTYFYTLAGVVQAVDGINLNIMKGETLGIVGESGSGKTVTVLSILRIIPSPGRIIAGKILYKNEDLMTKPESEMLNIRGKEMAMSFQDPTTALNPVYTIGDQIIEVIKRHQKIESKEEAEQKTIELLQAVGIPDPHSKIWHYPWEFSGGMKQRIAFARAVACRPHLLFADEPTTSLDVTIQAQILEFLKDLKKNFDMTLVLISHDMGVIYEMADRISVLYAGHNCETADRDTIFKNPRHPYTKALMTSVPRIGTTIENLKTIPGEIPDLVYPPTGCRFHPRCEYGKAICSQEKPPYEDLGDGHFIACHRWREI
jgi:peptide/nickel transport system ATP-binding protein